MSKKKFKKEDLQDAINAKFGSIIEYAEHLGISRSALYQKIDAQSRKFIKQLIEDGIQLPEPRIVNQNVKDINIEGKNSGVAGNSNMSTHIVNEAEASYKASELKLLKEEIKHLKALIEEKDKIIASKDEIIELLKSQQMQTGMGSY